MTTNTPPKTASAKEIQAHDHRNRLLARSDWTQLPDSPFDAATKLAWATYRQALRDLPEQPNFPNIPFPQEPK